MAMDMERELNILKISFFGLKFILEPNNQIPSFDSPLSLFLNCNIWWSDDKDHQLNSAPCEY